MLTMNGTVEKSRVFSLPEYTVRLALGMDQGSYGSPEKSRPPPRTAASYKVHGHSQILRIRAEDSHLGEDVAHFMIFSRPILPASPLSGKAAH